MFCKHCGKTIDDDSKFCNICGGTIPQKQNDDDIKQETSENLEVISENNNQIEVAEENQEDNQSELIEVELLQTIPDVVPEVKKFVICKLCGNEVDINREYCNKCGTDIDKNDNKIAENNESQEVPKEAVEVNANINPAKASGGFRNIVANFGRVLIGISLLLLFVSSFLNLSINPIILVVGVAIGIILSALNIKRPLRISKIIELGVAVILLIVVIVYAILLFGGTDSNNLKNESVILSQTYTNDDIGFIFNYPSDWWIAEPTTILDIIEIRSSDGSAGFKIIETYYDPFGVFTDSKSAIEQSVNEWHNFLDLWDMSISGIPVKAIKYQTQGLRGDNISKNYWYIINDNIYQIISTFPINETDSYEPVLNTIMDSYRITSKENVNELNINPNITEHSPTTAQPAPTEAPTAKPTELPTIKPTNPPTEPPTQPPTEAKLNGYHVQNYTNGDKYAGNFVNGIRSGHGTYTWSNGTVYEGEWKNGNRHGSGIFTDRNGVQWQQDWTNGELNWEEKISTGNNSTNGEYLQITDYEIWDYGGNTTISIYVYYLQNGVQKYVDLDDTIAGFSEIIDINSDGINEIVIYKRAYNLDVPRSSMPYYAQIYNVNSQGKTINTSDLYPEYYSRELDKKIDEYNNYPDDVTLAEIYALQDVVDGTIKPTSFEERIYYYYDNIVSGHTFNAIAIMKNLYVEPTELGITYSDLFEFHCTSTRWEISEDDNGDDTIQINANMNNGDFAVFDFKLYLTDNGQFGVYPRWVSISGYVMFSLEASEYLQGLVNTYFNY